MKASIQIPPMEYEKRADQLVEHLTASGLSGAVLFDNYYILYYTGFAFIPTERPIALVFNVSGERAMFVPRLEAEHAQSNAFAERVDHYVEYPHDPHPMEIFRRTLEDLGVRGRLGADHDGYPWILGYRGPKLSELTGGEVVNIAGFVEDQMMVKSPAEIALIRESVKWGNLAHVLLQRYTRAGVTETEASQQASMEANLAMLKPSGRSTGLKAPSRKG
jgi:Xaa-Pro dipeptidase